MTRAAGVYRACVEQGHFSDPIPSVAVCAFPPHERVTSRSLAVTL